MRYHKATFELLGEAPNLAPLVEAEIRECEARLGFSLPRSVYEWYAQEGAISILAHHSNEDPPIPLQSFSVVDWESHQLLPFRIENQGVSVWAIMLDGTDDPPVYADVGSGGKEWHLLASSFSAYVYSCVWDYKCVFYQPAIVQAQNRYLSSTALGNLRAAFKEEIQTFGWPGCAQYRFKGSRQAILIWSRKQQADWFVAASDERRLLRALQVVWRFDSVGKALYHMSDAGKAALALIKGKA